MVQLRDVAHWSEVREQWPDLDYLVVMELGLDVEEKYQNKLRVMVSGLSK